MWREGRYNTEKVCGRGAKHTKSFVCDMNSSYIHILKSVTAF